MVGFAEVACELDSRGQIPVPIHCLCTRFPSGFPGDNAEVSYPLSRHLPQGAACYSPVGQHQGLRVTALLRLVLSHGPCVFLRLTAHGLALPTPQYPPPHRDEGEMVCPALFPEGQTRAPSAPASSARASGSAASREHLSAPTLPGLSAPTM